MRPGIAAAAVILSSALYIGLPHLFLSRRHADGRLVCRSCSVRRSLDLPRGPLPQDALARRQHQDGLIEARIAAAAAIVLAADPPLVAVAVAVAPAAAPEVAPAATPEIAPAAAVGTAGLAAVDACPPLPQINLPIILKENDEMKDAEVVFC